MPTPPKYYWDDSVARYRDARGRFVAQSTVRRALDLTLENAASPAGRVRILSEQLQAGKISLADWQTGMMREVKNVHINSAVSAKGGWEQMSQADWGRVGQRVRFHYEKLDNFARQIESGEVVLDGRFMNRAEMYVEAGRSTHERQTQAERAKRGYTEMKNILEDYVRSCAGEVSGRPGCQDLTALGWIPVDDARWAPPGERICLGRCRCRVAYRNPATGDVIEG